MQALILYSEYHNLRSVAKSVGFVHQTVRNLLNRYLDGGLQALLNEKRGGRRRSYMTHEEEEAFLKEQLSSALNGEFVTLFEVYQEKVGYKTTREGFYVLLKRHGLVKESRDSLRWEIKLTQ
ncbi:TPA: helix-turn-helix domain-containing protein [Streptococcus suis]|nr:helix-turn-helix domain-containing protein [Streptococcus suis]HEM5162390.1 helix-turn-helix domain-containing protein [Streptococcus suis]